MTRALLLLTLVLGLVAAPAQAWRRPVPGEVSRSFAYSPAAPFAAGEHRGADFAARPGETVHAACSGRVAYAGHGVVTLRCGPWRVTHLPLEKLAVAAGARVREGARLGALAAGGLGTPPASRGHAGPSAPPAGRGHAGLHLGVRRAGARFAYVDPLPFLGPPVPRGGPPGNAIRRAPPGRSTAPRDAPHVAPRSAPPARHVAPRTAAPALRVVAPPHPVGAGVRVQPLAAWPAWLGLALVLAGAIGGGLRVRVRRRRMLAAAVSRT